MWSNLFSIPQFGVIMRYYLAGCLLFFTLFSFAQKKNQQTQAIGVHLSKPFIVTFNDADTKLAGSNEITCEAIIARGEMSPRLVEVSLVKENGIWKGELLIDDINSQYIIYRYVSGENKEDNNGNPNTLVVLDQKGKPVEGAHLGIGYFYSSGRFYDFKGNLDLKKGRAEFELEKKLFPKSWKPVLALLELKVKEKYEEKDKSKLIKELDSFVAKHKNDEDAISGAINLYERIGDTTKADLSRDEIISKYPKGKIALSKQSNLILKEKDIPKRIELIEKLLNDYPDMQNDSRQMWLQNLARSYIQAKDYENAASAISKMEKPNANLYNSISWPLIEKGEKLDVAIGWAKKGINILKSYSISDKPPYMKKKDWEENNKYTLVMILDTYGTGLKKSGISDEALKAFEEAYTLGEGSDPEMNLNYIKALSSENKSEKAIEVGLNCVKKGKDSPEIVESLKESFASSISANLKYDSLNSTDKKRFDDMLADANKIKFDELRKKIKESRINQSSVDFTLKDLDGVSTTLSALKGSVVVVDFWATWCGPCKMSFPYLQKVYEKYRNNNNVKFIAVNTWERQKNYNDQLENAKKFIQDNKYTFPVLIDEKADDQFKVIGDYEVEGIPTKFIIDKNGNIAFKSVGFDGPAMEDELTEQIEFLLNE